MLADGTVRLNFIEASDAKLSSKFEAAVQATLGFAPTEERNTVEAHFGDDKLALFCIQGEAVVAADHSAAEAATMTSDPEAIVQGEDLDSRAALCTISKVEAGKLKLPRVGSSDLRVMGPKTVDHQVNRKEKAYNSPAGWRAVVGSIQLFGHSEDDEYAYEHAELSIARDAIAGTATGTGFAQQALWYDVAEVTVLGVGSTSSFKVVVSEVPPSEDPEEVAYTAADGITTVVEAIGLARSTVAGLEVFVPPAPSDTPDLSMLNPRDQARELARLQREQVKAQLGSMGGGRSFARVERSAEELAARDAQRGERGGRGDGGYDRGGGGRW